MRKWLTVIAGMCLALTLHAQAALIQWSNPSFEDVPGPGRPPLGWYFCGPPQETPPDVHPVYLLNVNLPARHGKTYAGLVLRDNGTQETLGQSLDDSLQAGQCYLLRLYACRSPQFSSYSRLSGLPANFSQPAKLQLWGGAGHCRSETLLAETPMISDTSWQLYELSFSPQADFNQLFFTAAYADETTPYNGHILLDHLSPVTPVDCASGVPVSTGLLGEKTISAEGQGDISSHVEAEARHIKWVRDGFSLEQQLLPIPGSATSWVSGNAAIYQITHFMNAHPDALLTIAVGPHKNPLVQHHIRLLAAEFLAAGLPPERCLIRPLKKRDLRRDDWLRSDYEANHLLWGVSVR